MHLTEIKLSLSLSLLYIAAATAVTPSHPDPFHSSCVLATDRHALAPISRYPCEAPYAASICVTSILESFVPGSTLTSTLFVRRLDLPSPIQPRIPWPSLPTANAEAPPSALSCSNMGNIVFPPPPSSIPALLLASSCFFSPQCFRPPGPFDAAIQDASKLYAGSRVCHPDSVKEALILQVMLGGSTDLCLGLALCRPIPIVRRRRDDRLGLQQQGEGAAAA